MDVKTLSSFDLAVSASFLVLLALVSIFLKLGLGKRMLVNGLRMTIQLLFLGMVLKVLFAHANVWAIIFMSVVMLLVAGREVRARQKRRVSGWTGYFIGTGAMFVSSFSVALLALTVIVDVDPWYTPQYAIPLLGMLLGNTMNGVSLASDLLTAQLYEQRDVVEQRLILGQTWQDATVDIRRGCMRTGMVPIINAMAAAGVVSLPGMMTGQILGGSSPLDAVKYQIMIIFLIAAGTGFGILFTIWLIGRHLFDHRHRLNLDRLVSRK